MVAKTHIRVDVVVFAVFVGARYADTSALARESEGGRLGGLSTSVEPMERRLEWFVVAYQHGYHVVVQQQLNKHVKYVG